MKRALISLLVGISLFVILSLVGFFLMTSLLSGEGRKAEFEAPGILVVDLRGTVVERAPTDYFQAGLEGASHELFDLVRALERAVEDERIGGVYLRVDAPAHGWAMAGEIRRRLVRIREAGKPVHGFTAFTNELGYSTLSAADRIDVLPGALVEMNGFRAQAPFIRRLLDKVGIEPQVEAVGVYKSALDVLARDNMSDAQREVTEAILAERLARFVEEVSDARDVDPGRLRDALASGVYLAGDLLTLGLVDGEAHEIEVQRALLESVIGAGIDREDVAAHLVDVRDYAADLPDPEGEAGGTLALVYAVGTITAGESGYDPIVGRTIGSGTMTRVLRDVAADEEAGAVVVRIDSPGGDAFASEEIWGSIRALAERRPVIVSMGDVAASGGYYIAAGADEIVAEPASITGSIGVLAVLFDASEAYEKLGISWDTVATGRAATFPTSTRPLTDEERQTFRLLVEDTYHTFLDRVAEGRERTAAEIDVVAQGRVWTGAQAVEQGLVDRLGGLDEAFRAAKEAAGIDPDSRVRLHVYPRRQTLLERIRDALVFRGLGAPAAGDLERGVAVAVGRELVRSMVWLAASLTTEPGRPLTVAPWIPEIR